MFQPYNDNEYLWKNLYVSNEDEKIDDEIKENYKTPGHPTAFSNAKNVYKFYNGIYSLRRIKNILKGIESYSIHKEFHKGVRNISYARYKRYQFQIDLCFLMDYAEWNDGVKYLLTVIDCFTRFAFVRTLVDKNSNTVLKAFQNVIDTLDVKPRNIVCDRGNEFVNKNFINYCKQQKMTLIQPKSNVHAAYVERFNRTIQNLIYKFMTENSTNRYVDHLDDILNSYNSRYHRMIDMSPMEAETNPEAELHINNLISSNELKIKRKIPSYKIGDFVRIAKQKNTFSRGYQPQSQIEIFRIQKISSNKRIPLYYLSNYDQTENIEGGFYEFELTPVNIETFRIEKILKRRKYRGENQIFVKWLGYSDKYNQWIPESDANQIV
jgi:hypothetical protein